MTAAHGVGRGLTPRGGRVDDGLESDDDPIACALWAQECPDGEKCVPRADDGGRPLGSVRYWGDHSHGQLGIGNQLTIGDGPGEMPPADAKLGGIALQIISGSNALQRSPDSARTCQRRPSRPS